MITTLATALSFTLAIASQLQNELDNVEGPQLDAEGWQDVADDLKKVQAYAQQRANALAEPADLL